MSYKCTLYDKRNEICQKYPWNKEAYFFESCQYIKDGKYLLNLQFAPFVADASPSRPILYKINEL